MTPRNKNPAEQNCFATEGKTSAFSAGELKEFSHSGVSSEIITSSIPVPLTFETTRENKSLLNSECTVKSTHKKVPSWMNYSSLYIKTVCQCLKRYCVLHIKSKKIRSVCQMLSCTLGQILMYFCELY